MESQSAEFDSLAEDYSRMMVADMGAFGKLRDSAFVYKTNFLKRLFAKRPPRAILDFGCGVGALTPYLHSAFPQSALFGCDISSKSIEIAQKNHPYCAFQVINTINGLQTYSDVDCVLVNTVLHHIPEAEHTNLTAALRKALAKGGENLHGGGGGGS